MRLNIEQIKNITVGAVRITEEQDGFHFYRYTEEQDRFYFERDKEFSGFYAKSHATSGMRMVFKTDGRSVAVKGKVLKGTSRSYYSVDVFVNGSAVGYVDNFSGAEMPENFTLYQGELGEFQGSFDLGDGVKEVCIYLPWSVITVISSIEIEGATFVEGIKRDRTLVAFGDSITQGYDALRPSMRYASVLADRLGADEINKAIGGEITVPELAGMREEFTPDYITVAYGTNDWSLRPEPDFKARCREFYLTLSKTYPDSKIFAITPIWRADFEGERKFGAFGLVEGDIAEAVADLDNVTLIRGFDLVPHDKKHYADLRLHPNDSGFAYYGENLYREIKAVGDR